MAVYKAPLKDIQFVLNEVLDVSQLAKLPGYEGSETYIDMNVFHGTQAAFDAYPGT
jgi:hypothetical protein